MKTNNRKNDREKEKDETIEVKTAEETDRWREGEEKALYWNKDTRTKGVKREVEEKRDRVWETVTNRDSRKDWEKI